MALVAKTTLVIALLAAELARMRERRRLGRLFVVVKSAMHWESEAPTTVVPPIPVKETLFVLNTFLLTLSSSEPPSEPACLPAGRGRFGR